MNHPEDPAAETVAAFTQRAMDGIALEAIAAFNAVPKRGAEAGGVLLGRRSAAGILVEDFEPVLCEHRFGPSYVLSDTDLQGLEETVSYFRSASRDGLSVLGFYRSSTRPEGGWSQRDTDLMEAYFPGPAPIFLLLTPSRTQRMSAEVFLPGQRGSTRVGGPAPFPFEAPIVLPPPVLALSPAEAPPASVTAEPLSPERHRLAPPAHPRPEAERPPSHVARWWIAVVLALSVGGAVLGYRSGIRTVPVNPPDAASVKAPSAGASVKAPGPAASASVKAPAPESSSVLAAPQGTADRSISESASTELDAVRAALERWERATRSGNPSRIAACYAPRITRYLDQTDSSPEEVRRSVGRSTARYGKPAILRLSELSVEPLSEGQAVATFRKHWQTTGRSSYTGEGQERLVFAKVRGVWKIVSEEETRVYWLHRTR